MTARIKAFVADHVRQDEGADRTLVATISTGELDRYNDRVYPSGWDFTAYKQNPVVLWAHQYSSPPVGRSVEIRSDGEHVVSTMEFASRDQYPFADTVYRLYLGDYMKAFSVGFRPLDFHLNEAGGFNFTQQELLEYSAVPVPANAGALVAAKSAGIDTDPIREWAESALDSCHGGEPGCWIPRKALEDTYWAAGGRRSYPAVELRADDEFREDRERVVRDLLDEFEAMTTE